MASFSGVCGGWGKGTEEAVVSSGGKAAVDVGASICRLPVLQRSREPSIRLDTGSFAFDKRMCVVEGHSVIADKVGDDHSSGARDSLVTMDKHISATFQSSVDVITDGL